MKIALIGYGKMGKAIESIAIEQGHEIVLKITSQNLNDLNNDQLQKADVAIEFTNPHSAVENIKRCFDAQVPVICGSTGWYAQLDEVKEYCHQNNGALLYASNFSIGVNILFEINELLARLMKQHQSYHLSINEIHHTHKKDAPSGTAISLAEGIMNNNPHKTNWVLGSTENNHEIGITSERVDPAPGTHVVKYTSPIDDIEIKHTAHNRIGFATGALVAAEFLLGKKGVFTMKDVLNS